MEPSEKEAIRSRTDIVELIGGYTNLKPSGRRFKGLCPFHQEKTPSFQVDPERGSWHCYGSCAEHGDVFSFLMKIEGLTFPEAAERLANRAGITLTPFGGADRDETDRLQKERSRLYAVNALAVEYFRTAFANTMFAKEYALQRGLVHQTWQDFGIGFAPDTWTGLSEFLNAQKVHLADAEKAGLISPGKRNDGTYFDRFRGRLIFPIYDTQERVIAFGGRLLVPREDSPKYLNSPETPLFSKSRTLYALNRARKAIAQRDLVIIVEGYMDAVAAHQAGIAFVVATLGTALTEEHVRLVRRYTRNVILSFDADDAGVRAALRSTELFAQVGTDFKLRILSLPPGDDPDSILRRGDIAGFHRAIDNAISVSEFRIHTLEKRHDMTKETGRLDFLREAIPVIAALDSPLEQDTLLRRLAPYHPTFASGGARAEESLRAEILRARNNQAAEAHKMPLQTNTHYRDPWNKSLPENAKMPEPTRAEPRRNGAREAERLLLRALLSAEWVASVRDRLEPGLFFDGIASHLVESLLPLVGSGGYNPDAALDELADTSLADYAHNLLLQPEIEPISLEIIEDSLNLLLKRRVQQEIYEIRTDVTTNREGNGSGEDELLRRWQQKAQAMKRGKTTLEDDSLR